jgi:hypothetical protein
VSRIGWKRNPRRWCAGVRSRWNAHDVRLPLTGLLRSSAALVAMRVSRCWNRLRDGCGSLTTALLSLSWLWTYTSAQVTTGVAVVAESFGVALAD